MGNLLAITVHAANIHDTKSGILPVGKALKQYPRIQRFCADAGYRGTFVREMAEKFHLGVDISEKIKPHEWEKLPWRWVVERTFGWINHSRRLSKDYEIKEPVFIGGVRRMGEGFSHQSRRSDAGILCVFQGEATRSGKGPQ